MKVSKGSMAAGNARFSGVIADLSTALRRSRLPQAGSTYRRRASSTTSSLELVRDAAWVRNLPSVS
jgi:hypothetical protein